MYILNTTFVVDPSQQDAWLDVIKNIYIPYLNEEGFVDITFTRIISIEPVKQFTYSLQVGVEDMGKYKLLTESVFQKYEVVASPMFGDRVVWFTSFMKKIEL